MDYLNRVFKFLFPNENYYVPVIVLFVVIVILAILLVLRRLESQRANLVLAIVIASLLLIVMAADTKRRWQWIVGLLPALMVGYQAFFLWLDRPKEVASSVDIAGQGKRESLKQAHEAINSFFGLRTLFIRYGLPAVLLGITEIIIIDILVEPERYFSLINDSTTGANIEKILRGIKLGAVGSYMYVLLELGRRTFRHDITGASAMWCLVTLVLGPVLAATVAVLWRLDGPETSGWWGAGVVLFFTGFAPRRIIAAIEQAALQLLKIGPQSVVATRLIPLTKIRGISPQIEERLGEEGILDGNSLAATEPLRLVRNTSFDMRLILCWIDEAILIVTLPKSWEALEEEGITGAIDLAWYYIRYLDPQTGSLPAPMPEPIKALAGKAKFDSPENFVAIIERLSQDKQVRYIWTLYNYFTEYSGGGRPNTSRDSESTPDSPSQNSTDTA